MKFSPWNAYTRAVVSVCCGATLGHASPGWGAMKPLGDGFIKLVKMPIPPIVFTTVAKGIARMGDLKKVGRVGLKDILCFEVLTTVALVVGLVVAKLLQPGQNIKPATLDTQATATCTAGSRALSTADFILHTIHPLRCRECL